MELSAREKRKQKMQAKGYYDLTPSDRAGQLRKGFDALRTLVDKMDPEARKWLGKKEAEDCPL